MTETRKRIKELKDALPRARERIVAVAVLLAMSVTMMATVSYAWYTMSVAPEIGSIRTTVSSNGNLEVALAGRYDEDGNLLEPAQSAAGDSFAAEGQTPDRANLTWGNLINLSEIYGLESLTLRPATFKDNSDAFLSSVIYGEDGRVEGSTNKFDFTYWTRDSGGNYSFATDIQQRFGVRAISSVAYPTPEIDLKLAPARSYFAFAQQEYTTLVGNDDYIGTIESLVNKYVNKAVEDYVSAKFSGTQPGPVNFDISSTERNYLADMMQTLLDKVYQNYGEMLAAMATAQLSLQSNKYTVYTWETLQTATPEELAKVTLVTLSAFKTRYLQIKEDAQTLSGYVATNKSLKWADIKDIVNQLIDIETVELMIGTKGEILTNDGYTIYEITHGAIGGVDELLAYGSTLTNSTIVPVKIYNGSLCDFERWTGTYMYAGLNVTAKYMGMNAINIKNDRAKLHTKWRDAGQAALYYQEEDATIDLSESGVYEGPKTALETYGMVIDLWVRTNAANSIVTLDGTVKTKMVQALEVMIPSGSSESRQKFIYTYYTGKTSSLGGITRPETIPVEMFQIPADLNGNGTIERTTYKIELNKEEVEYIVYEGYFYDAISYDLVPLRDANGKEVQATDEDGNKLTDGEGKPIYVYLNGDHFDQTDVEIEPAVYEYPVVTGYEASNRVDGQYSESATNKGWVSATQGSGSCYIFYAEPDEADAALKLLKHLKIAFCDENNHCMATGRLAVESVLAESGKYTVPILVDWSEVTYTVTNEDDSEEMRFGITSLVQGEAKRISMVVYLEGTLVDNTMVMEKDSILGSLNIQFASNAKLNALDDTALSEKNIKLSATIKDGNAHEQEMTIDPQNPSATTTRLNAVIEGLTPTKVQAVFRRQINAYQGSSMEPVTLDRSLSANVYFSMPGTYVLRSLLIDGVEYPLPQSSWITVVVNGFSIDDIEFCETVGSNMALTAESFASAPISVWFTNGTLVESVTARFVEDDGEVVDAILHGTENAGEFDGDVRFRSSGHYTLTYLIVNGEFYDIPETMRKDFTAWLGLRAEVSLRPVTENLGFTFPFKGPEEYTAFVRILTDSDEALKNMTGVKLQYGKRGSSLDPEGMDPQLTWNGEYYVGTLNVKSVGVYSFKYLQVGDDVITQYNFAPTIAAQATEPPVMKLLGTPLWDSGSNKETEDLMIMSDIVSRSSGSRDPYYRVELTNIGGVLEYSAVFIDPDGKERIITIGDDMGADGKDPDGYVEQPDPSKEVYVVYFKLPRRINAVNYNGDWKFREIRLSPVYDEKGNYYGPVEEGDTETVAVAAFYTLAKEDTFSILSAVDSFFNKDKDNNVSIVTNKFMESVATNVNTTVGWTPKLTHGGTLTVKKVVVTLAHSKGSMSNYYDVSDTDYAKLTTGIELDMQLQDGKWVAKSADTLNVAGDYIVQKTVVTIEDEQGNAYTFTVSGNSQKVLTINTTLPTVTIEAISPNGTHKGYWSSTTTGSGCDQKTTYSTEDRVSSFDQYSATIWPRAAIDTGLVSAGGYYTQPTLTLQINNITNFDSATVVLPGNVVGTREVPPVIYIFDPGNLTVVRSIGLLTDAKSSGSSRVYAKYYGHGKQTIESVSIQVGDITFTVQLSIVIDSKYENYGE